MQAFLSGALLCSGLIVAFGPQNLHVLRAGLARRHVALTVLVCVGIDAALLALALGGGSAALLAGATLQPWLLGGAAMLLAAMALQALRDACMPSHAQGQATPGAAAADMAPGRRRAVFSAFAVSLGNPAVWIETLMVLGATALAYPVQERAAFASGALLASASWFSLLGFGARALARWLARPLLLRRLSLGSALAMSLMTLRLSQALVAH